MSTTVKYDNFMFTGASGFPTPYVSRTQNMLSYGNRWGQGTTYALNGQVTGHSFGDLIYKQNVLLSGFARDYKSLDITEDGESVAGFPAKNCKINNINFDANKYSMLVDYDVNITAYDETLFSGNYGVTEPSDSVSIQEDAGGNISLSHKISARGFAANDKSAIQNAKDFVHSNTGWNEQIFPKFITYQQFEKQLYQVVDFYNNEGWFVTNGSMVYASIGAKQALKMTANSTNGAHFLEQTFSEIEVGKRYIIDAEIFIGNSLPLEDQNIKIVEISNGSINGNSIITEGGTQGEWVKVEQDFIADSDTIYIKTKESSSDYTYAGDSSNRDWFAIHNVRLRRYYGFKPLLTSQSENIDRLNGAYSVDETYSMSNTGEQKLFSGYNVEISSGIGQNFLNVDFSARYKGELGEDIKETRDKIPELTSQYYYNIAKSLSNISDLNSGASKFSVSESSGARSIEISTSFNNNPLFSGSNVYFDYEISSKTDELTFNTSLSINGTIKTMGNKKDRFRIAENFLENTVYAQSSSCNGEIKYACYLHGLANTEYTNMSKSYTLNKYPISSSIQKNESEGTISLSASFDDKYNYSDDVKNSTWSIAVKPALTKYITTNDVITYPKHIFWNTKVLQRSSVSVNASAVSYDSINKSYGLTSVDNFIENVYNVYVSPNSDIMEMSNELSFNEVSLSYNRNKSWSFHNSKEWAILPSPKKP